MNDEPTKLKDIIRKLSQTIDHLAISLMNLNSLTDEELILIKAAADMAKDVL